MALVIFVIVVALYSCRSPCKHRNACVDGLKQMALCGLHCVDDFVQILCYCIIRMVLCEWFCVECLAWIALWVCIAHKFHCINSIV